MPEEPTDEAARDGTRIALILGCVIAALVVALVVPTLGSGGIRGSPIDSVLPGDRFSTDDGQGGGFGALNPGESTGVGGETGFDKDTFASNDTEVHFEVESSTSAYWRTGTYDSYTGTGWERDTSTTPYDGPIDYDGLSGDDLVYEVEFMKAASTLPTAWRPVSVSGVDELSVTETGSIQTDGTVEPGTTFSGVSRKPERDVDLLRTAGQDYPDAIRERYTQLPRDTPLRVSEFTDDLTADEDNAYDTAMTIQNWLRSNKGYSLQADEQSEHIADTFIFDMQEGYCEYFATAMTTMLRSQGIPARYTVGYTTGQEISENRYQVRGMNAHAWVEVYFPDVGWVRFDPTPGDSRLQTQEDILDAEQPDLEYNITEPGSPGEEFRPGQINDVTGDGPDDDTDPAESDGGYDISLNRTAVPGLPVEVTVTLDGDPVEDTQVLFDGDPVGTTDQEGTVVATVPESEELRVSIEPPDFEGVDQNIAPAVGLASGAADRSVPLGAGTGSAGAQADPDNETVVDVATDASVSVSGDLYPGTNATVVVTVEEVAIPDASVFLDGSRVGETNEDGRVRIRLPEEAGNTTIAVERGPVFGETTVRIETVELDVNSGLIALPLTEATAEVTADGEGLANAPVAVDGTDVAQTDTDGTARVRLPLSSSATISTSQNGLSRETTVDGLYRNAGVVLGGLALAIVIPAGLAYRRGYGRSEFVAGLRGIAARVARFPGWLGHRLDWLFGAIAARTSKTLIHLAGLAAGSQTPSELRTALGRWLRETLAGFRGLLPGRPEAATRGSESPTAQPPDVPTVRDAWDRFLVVLDTDAAETKTPGELATEAIERGLPREPVEELRDVFRAVEYGDRSGGERDDQVRSAIEAIEQAVGATELGATDASPGTDGTSTGSADDRTGGTASRDGAESPGSSRSVEQQPARTAPRHDHSENGQEPAAEALHGEPSAGGDQ
jgi:transglutaminase-like putative cysteine protease